MNTPSTTATGNRNNVSYFPFLVTPTAPDNGDGEGLFISRPLDVMGRPKPFARVHSTKQSIWFTLYRRAKYPVGGYEQGEWVPITRVLPANQKRRATLRKMPVTFGVAA